MVIALASVLAYVLVARERAGPDPDPPAGATGEVTWADPEARPRF
jgi:hypothetical protein